MTDHVELMTGDQFTKILFESFEKSKKDRSEHSMRRLDSGKKPGNARKFSFENSECVVGGYRLEESPCTVQIPV